MVTELTLLLISLNIFETEEVQDAHVIFNVCSDSEYQNIVNLIKYDDSYSAREEYEFLKFKYEEEL